MTHVVLLVHGIRDFGTRWMREVSKVLNGNGTKVIATSFGYFDVFRFLSPIDFSNRPIELVKKAIENAQTVHTRDNKVPDVSVICHSFGTYVVTKLLERDGNIRLRRLILCGSVVDEHLDWSKIAQQVGDPAEPDKSKFIYNDCGEHDHWPALGKAAGWRYGKGGVDGFKNAYVTDRFHKGSHSVFLDSDWAETYWKPIIHDEAVLSSEKVRWGEGTPESLPSWIRYLAAMPLNWLILFIKLLVLALIVYGTYLGVNSFASSVGPVELTIIDDQSDCPIHRNFTLLYSTNSTKDASVDGNQGVCWIPKGDINDAFDVLDVVFKDSRAFKLKPQSEPSIVEVDGAQRATVRLSRTLDFVHEIAPNSPFTTGNSPSANDYRTALLNPDPNIDLDKVTLRCESNTDHKIDVFFHHFYLEKINREEGFERGEFAVDPSHYLVSKDSPDELKGPFQFRPGYFFGWVSEFGNEAEFVDIVNLFERQKNVIFFKEGKSGYELHFVD